MLVGDTARFVGSVMMVSHICDPDEKRIQGLFRAGDLSGGGYVMPGMPKKASGTPVRLTVPSWP